MSKATPTIKENAEPDRILDELENITDSVTQALIHHDTASLEHLVVSQCQWARKLAQFPKDHLDVERIHAMLAKVDVQQKLVGQALQVTDFFLSRLNDSRTFNRLG